MQFVNPVATQSDSATTALNLSGGGSAAGVTVIDGSFVIGDPAAAHVVIGSDALGADGVRVYGSDGVTPLIDLSIATVASITGALLRTAAAGQRVELSSSDVDRVNFYTANAAVLPGLLRSALISAGLPGEQPYVSLESPTEPGRANAGVQVLGELANSAGTSQINLFADKIVAGGVLENFAGNPYPEWATDTTQRQLAAATIIPTLDANGEVVIAHGLANTPLYVGVQPGLATPSYSCEVGNIGAANFTVRVFVTNTGARAAGVSMTLRWIALG